MTESLSRAGLEPVVAVMAAFRPDETIIANVERVVSQVHRVVVVDDGSGDEFSDLFARLQHRGQQVQVVRVDRNRGIAAALNRGIDRARELGARAILTLDQDSLLSPNYVSEACGSIRRLNAGGIGFAAIAAGEQSGRPVRPVGLADRGNRLTPTMEAIQSGLLIPCSVLERIGSFDESLFIDCVDTDFVMRAARAGLPTYLDRRCRINHPLGRTIDMGEMRVSRSGSRTFAFHPAWRRYYISRNRAVMLGRHGIHRPRWAALSLAGETVQLLRSLVFGPEKGKQTAAVLFGLIDAVRGRRGRLVGWSGSVLGAPR